jgi:hypothetical protein
LRAWPPNILAGKIFASVSILPKVTGDPVIAEIWTNTYSTRLHWFLHFLNIYLLSDEAISILIFILRGLRSGDGALTVPLSTPRPDFAWKSDHELKQSIINNYYATP